VIEYSEIYYLLLANKSINDPLKIMLLQTALKFSNANKQSNLKVDSYWGFNTDKAWYRFKTANNITRKINLKDNKGAGFNGIMSEIEIAENVKIAWIEQALSHVKTGTYSGKIDGIAGAGFNRSVRAFLIKNLSKDELSGVNIGDLIKTKNYTALMFLVKKNIASIIGNTAFNSHGLAISKNDVIFEDGVMCINVSSGNSILKGENIKVYFYKDKLNNSLMFRVKGFDPTDTVSFNHRLDGVYDMLNGERLQKILQNKELLKNKMTVKK